MVNFMLCIFYNNFFKRNHLNIYVYTYQDTSVPSDLSDSFLEIALSSLILKSIHVENTESTEIKKKQAEYPEKNHC